MEGKVTGKLVTWGNIGLGNDGQRLTFATYCKMPLLLVPYNISRSYTGHAY